MFSNLQIYLSVLYARAKGPVLTTVKILLLSIWLPVVVHTFGAMPNHRDDPVLMFLSVILLGLLAGGSLLASYGIYQFFAWVFKRLKDFFVSVAREAERRREDLEFEREAEQAERERQAEAAREERIAEANRQHSERLVEQRAARRQELDRELGRQSGMNGSPDGRSQLSQMAMDDRPPRNMGEMVDRTLKNRNVKTKEEPEITARPNRLESI